MVLIMRKMILVVAVLGLTACSPVGAATGTIGGAAKSTVQTIGGWFGG